MKGKSVAAVLAGAALVLIGLTVVTRESGKSPAPVLEEAQSATPATVTGAADKEAGTEKPTPQVIVEEKQKAEPRPAVRISLSSDPLPSRMRAILGEGPKTDYRSRIQAVHGLPTDLSDNEIQALYAFINRKVGEDTLPPGQLNAIKNEVLDELRSQGEPSPDFAHNMMAMYYDTTHDTVWRDYCIQHLGIWYPKIGDADERSAAAQLFWNALENTATSLAGTALIALSDNIGQPGIEKSAVTQKALDLCADPGTAAVTKTTALQICAGQGDRRVLPVAREIAESSGNTPLRMSALAAIGTLGDKSDRALLERFASSSDVRLRTAARSALGRLSAKR